MLITALQDKPKVIFLFIFLTFKAWNLLCQLNQNMEEFPFKAAHFESGAFRNLSEDSMLSVINWFIEKRKTDHAYPSAGNLFSCILNLLGAFDAFCKNMEKRDLFIVFFYEKHQAEEKVNWETFLKMVNLFF